MNTIPKCLLLILVLSLLCSITLNAQSHSSKHYLQVFSPDHCKAQLSGAIQVTQNLDDNSFIFTLANDVSESLLTVEGPFGGIIKQNISFKQNSTQEIVISESKWTEDENNLGSLNKKELPQLCPRLIQNENTYVYDGKKDFFSFASTHDKAMLWLNAATVTFDFEDTSLLAGFDTQGKAYYEMGGGFYSNIHYVLIPYNESLLKIYKNMESDWIKLRKLEMQIATEKIPFNKRQQIENLMKVPFQNINGTGSTVGPYQILMNVFFRSLGQLPNPEQYAELPKPVVHGFLPGPFLGSNHLGYNLCEWGDTSFHAPLQNIQYQDYALGKWDEHFPQDKMILMLVESDEQMKKNNTRLNWEKLGVLRSWDYADDLIAFFVISKSSASKQLLSSPLGEVTLELESK